MLNLWIRFLDWITVDEDMRKLEAKLDRIEGKLVKHIDNMEKD